MQPLHCIDRMLYICLLTCKIFQISEDVSSYYFPTLRSVSHCRLYMNLYVRCVELDYYPSPTKEVQRNFCILLQIVTVYCSFTLTN
jgi:hypothetical protein